MRSWILAFGAALGLALWATAAVAAPSRLAVLELHDEAELGAAATGYLTDTVRGAAAAALGAGWFVLTRENLVTALPPGTDLAACAGDCEVEMGRTLGADQVLSGSVVRLEGALTVSLQLHATADGRLVGRETASGASAKALEGPLADAARTLLARLTPDAEPARVEIQGPRGLEVFIDGVQVGVTPVDPRKLTPGAHTLVVSARCLAELKLPLTLRSGERRVVAV
ncbi:MAG: PEGA domain-containing protein, partial [Myxococcales bacterium]|nr:PEGA domain-containing protein [Myxococcales bacterium]